MCWAKETKVGGSTKGSVVWAREGREEGKETRSWTLTEGSTGVILLDLSTLLLGEDHVRGESPANEGKKTRERKRRERREGDVSVVVRFASSSRPPLVELWDGESWGWRLRNSLLGSVLILGSLRGLLVLGGGGLGGCMRRKQGEKRREEKEEEERSACTPLV